MNGTETVKRLADFTSNVSLILKKIWAPISKVLTFSPADDVIYPGENISISIEKGNFSIVYGSRFFSRIRIKHLKTYSLEDNAYPQPEVVTSSLALAIHDFGKSKIDVTISIPKSWAVIRTVEFPVTVKENLSKVVSYELDRITPFNSEDAFYDYKVIEETDEKIKILVVATRADVIRPHIEALRENGINVNKVTINLSGIETLYRYFYKISDALFLDIKKDGYEGALFHKGSIIESFSGFFTTEDEPSKSDLVSSEIKPFLDKLNSYTESPQIIMLSDKKYINLMDILKEKFGVPIRTLNELDTKLKVSEKIKEIPYSAIGALFESLWPKAGGFNLLKKGEHVKPRSPKFLSLILIVAILVLWIIYLIAPLRIERKRLEEIDHQIALRKEEVKKIEGIKKEIESLQEEISTINNFKITSPMALDVLKELTLILPKNAWLSRVRIDTSNIYIEGYASSATGLLPKLEASAYFKKAEFASPTFRDTRMNADRFNIKAELEGVQHPTIQRKKGEELEDEEE